MSRLDDDEMMISDLHSRVQGSLQLHLAGSKTRFVGRGGGSSWWKLSWLAGGKENSRSTTQRKRLGQQNSKIQ
jgi:hypothetical protein